ncbi:hypothetical protein HPB50_015502 [Hyalomma asiaticum]|uniref:Uncharacterized protein n=1 Tax=Hyalomma asiaticum TaxID=266040 RepID=A0ACB7S3E1_HYAAI|nr:hypothetical protein HPB50_015502 [Hyalomma asiaticum]
MFKALQGGQSAMIEQLNSIRQTLSENEKKFNDINKRLDKIESDLKSIQCIKVQLENIETVANNCSAQVSQLSARVEDMECRSRRCNLVFYGLADKETETWRDSEELVMQHCKKNLDIVVQTRDIERAHRLGAFKHGKNRPIIVKFAHFKDKDHILSEGGKLKGTACGISEDFPPHTRLARRRLVEFAKAQNVPIKLRYDKLICGCPSSNVRLSTAWKLQLERKKLLAKLLSMIKDSQGAGATGCICATLAGQQREGSKVLAMSAPKQPASRFWFDNARYGCEAGGLTARGGVSSIGDVDELQPEDAIFDEEERAARETLIPAVKFAARVSSINSVITLRTLQRGVVDGVFITPK